MRSAVLALLLLVVFGLAGAGLHRLLSKRGLTPIVPVKAAQMVGQWRAEGLQLRIEAEGDHLKVFGMNQQGTLLFSASGQSRWAENEPESKVPRLLEWNGKALELKTTHDSGRVEAVTLQRSP
ncbi:hypothetical protein IV102_07615 [bacterium]|nr:hypothetical protein [bacterium]